MTKKQLYTLFIVIIIFGIAYVFLDNLSPELHAQFDLNKEANFPTWFSTILLAYISFFSFWNYKKVKNGDDKAEKFFWLQMSLAFLFLSIDELAQIHEMLDRYKPFLFLGIKKWVYIYAVPLILFSVFFLFYLFRHNKDKKFRKWILAGFAIYVFGAFVLEFISFKFYPLPYYIQKVEFLAEETAELSGAVLILHAVVYRWKKLA